ncbi:MAG TPA: hypothetical protein VI583_00850 [Cyclobacteriaceae bacterium]|nr:hypothetical protein [Cyclobacteriaceae bacterium]
MKTTFDEIYETISEFGLNVDEGGEVMIDRFLLTDIARRYGTPVHVVNLNRLAQNCLDFQNAFQKEYSGKVSVHYAFQCNPVAGIIRTIKGTGIKAEVMSEFELKLACNLGFRGEEIIVNGPCKTNSLITDCIQFGVRYLVIDSLDELDKIRKIAKGTGHVRVLLRINPDYIPKGMSSNAASGCHSHSAPGFDIKSDEVRVAFQVIQKASNIEFEGFHFNIGTCITRPDDYYNAILKLTPLVDLVQDFGFYIRTMDVGGGIASETSKAMSSKEWFYYHALNRLPRKTDHFHRPSYSEYASSIHHAIQDVFDGEWNPELILEPGRCITSNSQLLLVGVHQVKRRKGAGIWITTDGGIGTVCMPTFNEFHKIILCDNIYRPPSEYVTLNGPGYFTADVVYRNILMPELRVGDKLAIMDSGAYFTSGESNFGYPRPGVVAVNEKSVELIRRKESFEDWIGRDITNKNGNGIYPSYAKKNEYLSPVEDSKSGN